MVAQRGEGKLALLGASRRGECFQPSDQLDGGVRVVGFGLLAFYSTMPQCSGPKRVEIFIRVSAKTSKVPNPGVFSQIELGFPPGNRL